MLKYRVITAVVLAAVLLVALFTFTTWQIALIFGVFVLAGAWEWAALVGLAGGVERIAYVILVAATGILLLVIPGATLIVMVLSLLWWLWAFYQLTLYSGRAEDNPRPGLYRFVSGVFVLVPVWLAGIHLFDHDPRPPELLLYLFLLVWLADTAAYFTGKAFGHNRLAPRVSPGKTVEGLLGALVGATVLALVSAFGVWHFSGYDIVTWVLLAVAVVMFSVIGDLYVSMIKREAGVKDSGTLLPGHGGVLDRIDSMTAAAPVFVLGWWLLQRV